VRLEHRRRLHGIDEQFEGAAAKASSTRGGMNAGR